MNNFIDLHINSDLPDTSLDKPRPFNWYRALVVLFFFLVTAALIAGAIMEAQAQSTPTPVPPTQGGDDIMYTQEADYYIMLTASPNAIESPTPGWEQAYWERRYIAEGATLTAEFLGGGATATPIPTLILFGFDIKDTLEAGYYNATLTADPNTIPLRPTSRRQAIRQATWAAAGATLTAEVLDGGAVANIDSDIEVEVDAAATALALMVSTPNHRIMVSNRCDGPPRSESERQACDTYKALYRERYGNPCRTDAQGEAVCVH